MVNDPNDPGPLVLPGEKPNLNIKYYQELTDEEKIKEIENRIDSDEIERAVAECFYYRYEALANFVLAEYVKKKMSHFYKQVLLEDFSNEVEKKFNSEI